MHCITKTYSITQEAEYNTGSVCFETKWGALSNVSYHGGVEEDTAVFVAADSKWINEISSAKFDNRKWYLGGTTENLYKGLLNYYPTNSGTAAGDHTNSQMMWELFMPKWQTNDYYENNFRINKGDVVKMFYKDSCTGVCSLDVAVTFQSGGGMTMFNSATAITVSMGIAFAAAALTF